MHRTSARGANLTNSRIRESAAGTRGMLRHAAIYSSAHRKKGPVTSAKSSRK